MANFFTTHRPLSKIPVILRYPGNKFKNATQIVSYIPPVKAYFEPCIGSGAVLLNIANQFPDTQLYACDINPSIFFFWEALSSCSDFMFNRLCNRIEEADLSLEYYDKIKESRPSAFKFVFLNKTSYNGFVHKDTGPIGGRHQSGKYKVDFAWNPKALISTLKVYRKLVKGRLHLDKDMFKSWFWNLKNVFIYIDPPYYEQGKSLYGKEFGVFDHKRLFEILNSTTKPFLLSYDNHEEIRKMYKNFTINTIYNYSGRKHKREEELLISKTGERGYEKNNCRHGRCAV